MDLMELILWVGPEQRNPDFIFDTKQNVNKLLGTE